MKLDFIKDIIKINSVAVYTNTDSIYEFLVKYKDPSVFFKKYDELYLSNELLKERIKKFINDANAFDADNEIKECEKLGVKIITCLDEEYPQNLRNISNPPLVLYCLGDIKQRLNISIVGTRHPTDYGIRQASKISQELSKIGLCIVSGLARGIDTVVHKSVIKVGGITVAVIGSGLKRIYPSENKSLAQKIVEYGGAIISEYPLNMPPLKFNFPRRNRIVSALSFGTLVVEGDYNSGALITARYAVEQGREVMAIPGAVDVRQSNGPNKLIKEGAYPVRDFRDVIELIPSSELFNLDLSVLKNKQKDKLLPNLDGDKKMIYEIIRDRNELSIDEIANITAFSMDKLFVLLFELETLNLVERNNGKYRIVKNYI